MAAQTAVQSQRSRNGEFAASGHVLTLRGFPDSPEAYRDDASCRDRPRTPNLSAISLASGSVLPLIPLAEERGGKPCAGKVRKKRLETVRRFSFARGLVCFPLAGTLLTRSRCGLG